MDRNEKAPVSGSLRGFLLIPHSGFDRLAFA